MRCASFANYPDVKNCLNRMSQPLGWEVNSAIGLQRNGAKKCTWTATYKRMVSNEPPTKEELNLVKNCSPEKTHAAAGSSGCDETASGLCIVWTVDCCQCQSVFCAAWAEIKPGIAIVSECGPRHYFSTKNYALAMLSVRFEGTVEDWAACALALVSEPEPDDEGSYCWPLDWWDEKVAKPSQLGVFNDGNRMMIGITKNQKTNLQTFKKEISAHIPEKNHQTGAQGGSEAIFEYLENVYSEYPFKIEKSND